MRLLDVGVIGGLGVCFLFVRLDVHKELFSTLPLWAMPILGKHGRTVGNLNSDAGVTNASPTCP